ncbi:MAG TPA: hypothetical protein VFF70_13905 [Anaerolineae bacterium]|nr:hypothetical protein [Anaerolineae bacterium]
MTDLTWPQLSLSIAGLGVTIECNDQHVIDGLRDQWTAFNHHAPQIDLTARVQVDAAREPAAPDRPLIFRRDRVEFISSGYAGSIDAQHGVGSLSISNRQPNDDVRYFLRVVYALLAFRSGGLMLHAAGIVRSGRAYLFFGPSGSGKTTTVKYSPDHLVLNDDLVILMPGSAQWEVFATPFWNEPQQRPNAQQHAPLAGLFRLVQSRSVFVEPMNGARAAAEVLASTPITPLNSGYATTLLQRIEILVRKYPVHRLHFLPDASFWNVIE